METREDKYSFRLYGNGNVSRIMTAASLKEIREYLRLYNTNDNYTVCRVHHTPYFHNEFFFCRFRRNPETGSWYRAV